MTAERLPAKCCGTCALYGEQKSEATGKALCKWRIPDFLKPNSLVDINASSVTLRFMPPWAGTTCPCWKEKP